MSDDIAAKLNSLRTLKAEMKDWKKDDLRKKKGIKDPEPVQEASEQTQDNKLADLISKLVG